MCYLFTYLYIHHRCDVFGNIKLCLHQDLNKTYDYLIGALSPNVAHSTSPVLEVLNNINTIILLYGVEEAPK